MTREDGAEGNAVTVGEAERGEGGGPADGAEGRSVGRLAATVMRLQKKVDEAYAAADGRALAAMAKGILVERLHCSPSQAARQLADLASAAGVSHLELAADIVNQAAGSTTSSGLESAVSRITGVSRSAMSALIARHSV